MGTLAQELIVLVPGSARMARGSQCERLVKGMTTTTERTNLDRVQAGDVPPGVIRLEEKNGTQTHRIDVVEAYWNDLAPSIQGSSAYARFIRGTSLLIYWGFSKVWMGFFGRMYLTLGLMAAGIALLTWYYGTVAMFLQAFLADQSASAEVRAALAPVLPLVDAVGTWKVWALSTLFMGLIPVDSLVEMLDLTKRYLTNERTDGESVGLRMALRRRVRDQIVAALDAAPYDRVTIVGHSFGNVIAVDVLADLPVSSRDVRFVTIGSPIELLERKAKWLETEVTKCRERPDLSSWIDIWSNDDWLASGSHLPKRGKARSLPVTIDGTIVDKVYGRTHRGYFDREEVVNVMLDAPQLGSAG